MVPVRPFYLGEMCRGIVLFTIDLADDHLPGPGWNIATQLTRITSSTSSQGDLLIMEWTVRSSVVQASLWNTITMEVVGSKLGYTLDLH